MNQKCLRTSSRSGLFLTPLSSIDASLHHTSQLFIPSLKLLLQGTLYKINSSRLSLSLRTRVSEVAFPCFLSLPILPSMSGSSIEEICSQNAAAAAHQGRADLVKAWSTAALVAADIGLTPPPNPTVMPWPRHPFCRSLVKSL